MYVHIGISSVGDPVVCYGVLMTALAFARGGFCASPAGAYVTVPRIIVSILIILITREGVTASDRFLLEDCLRKRSLAAPRDILASNKIAPSPEGCAS